MRYGLLCNPQGHIAAPPQLAPSARQAVHYPGIDTIALNGGNQKLPLFELASPNVLLSFTAPFVQSGNQVFSLVDLASNCCYPLATH